jgi:serine/threonine protein kinase
MNYPEFLNPQNFLANDINAAIDRFKNIQYAGLATAIKQRISQDSFEATTASFSIERKKNIIDALSTDSGQQQSEVAIVISKVANSIGRTLAISYHPQARLVTFDIYLKSKSEKLKKIQAARGADNKYTQLCTITIDKDATQSLQINMNYGQLIFMAENNNLAIKKVALQQALAKVDICLPVSLLPAGNKGKLSIKTPHATSLLDYQCTPECLKQIYKELIEKLATLHSCAIVHGDLKEENILILNDKHGHPHPYLADLDTLGFIHDLHGLQGTAGYILPSMSLYINCKTIGKENYPTEIRNVFAHSKVSDLYSLSKLISYKNDQLNLAAKYRLINKIDRIVEPYINPQNECYTKFSNALAKNNILSLDSLYKDLFHKDLTKKINVTEDNIVAIQNCLIAFKDQKPLHMFAWTNNISVSGMKNKISKFNLQLNDNYKQLDESEQKWLACFDVSYLFQSNSLHKSKKHLFDNGVDGNVDFFNEFVDKTKSNGYVISPKALDVFKDNVFVALQGINLIILQQQLLRLECDVDENHDNAYYVTQLLAELLAIDDTFSSMHKSLCNLKVINNKQAVKFSSLSQEDALQALEAKLQSTLRLDDDLSKYDLSQRNCIKYCKYLIKYGDFFAELSLGFFAQLQKPSHMKKIIHLYYEHLLVLAKVRSHLYEPNMRRTLVSNYHAVEKRLLAIKNIYKHQQQEQELSVGNHFKRLMNKN